MGQSSRRVVPILLVLVAAGVGLWLWGRGREAAAPAPIAKVEVPSPAQAPAGERQPPAAGALEPAVPPIAEAEPRADEEAVDEPDASELVMEDADGMAAAWAAVDMDAVRRAMPDNLYFQLSAPTEDEAELERRRAERDRWNTEYGKILSGTGTEEEIRSFYDQRAQLSSDYIEFATYLLDHYRETLPERDVGMLELARRLHAARIEEIPRKVEEAYERKRQQDAARAAWLAGEAEFAGEGEDEPE